MTEMVSDMMRGTVVNAVDTVMDSGAMQVAIVQCIYIIDMRYNVQLNIVQCIVIDWNWLKQIGLDSANCYVDLL